MLTQGKASCPPCCGILLRIHRPPPLKCHCALLCLQVTYHFLQCIFQHLHLTKGSGSGMPPAGAAGGFPMVSLELIPLLLSAALPVWLQCQVGLTILIQTQQQARGCGGKRTSTSRLAGPSAARHDELPHLRAYTGGPAGPSLKRVVVM